MQNGSQEAKTGVSVGLVPLEAPGRTVPWPFQLPEALASSARSPPSIFKAGPLSYIAAVLLPPSPTWLSTLVIAQGHLDGLPVLKSTD